MSPSNTPSTPPHPFDPHPLSYEPAAAAARPPSRLPSRIPSLDGLRAISICLVLASHAAETVSFGHDGPAWLPPATVLGSIGVSVFFVISGFLITHLLLRERETRGAISLRGFYARRVFRIFPAYYLVLAVVLVLQRAHVIGIKSRDIVAAGLFVWNYVPGTGNWWLGHTWSLNVEEQFYLFWPLLVCVLSVRSARRAAVLILLVVPVVRVATLLLLPPSHLLVQRMWHMGHTRIDTIMFGSLAALLYDREAFQRLLRRAFALRLQWLALGFMAIASPLLFARWNVRYLEYAGYTLEGVAVSVLILWSVQHAASPVGRALNWRPVVHLGVISYSLYLWQQFFLTPKNHTLAGTFPWNVACALLAAEASYFCVERPFLALRQRLAAPVRKAPAAGADPAERPVMSGI